MQPSRLPLREAYDAAMLRGLAARAATTGKPVDHWRLQPCRMVGAERMPPPRARRLNADQMRELAIFDRNRGWSKPSLGAYYLPFVVWRGKILTKIDVSLSRLKRSECSSQSHHVSNSLFDVSLQRCAFVLKCCVVY